MKIDDSRNSFIQLPHLTSAYSRPEYSSTRLSSIIEISIEPLGLSIGIRPFSARTIMKNAIAPSRWVGSTSRTARRRSRGSPGTGCPTRDSAPTVKNTRISAGSAKLPTQVVRLAPRPPSGLAVSSAGQRDHEARQAEHERAADQVGQERQRQRLSVMIGTIADTVR